MSSGASAAERAASAAHDARAPPPRPSTDGPPARQRTTITSLPPEIFMQVAAHIPESQALRNLSLSSSGLHALVAGGGWKTFALTQFPSIHVPPPPVPSELDVGRSQFQLQLQSQSQSESQPQSQLQSESPLQASPPPSYQHSLEHDPIALANAYYLSAAHALTTLTRNLDRRAFLARNISPPSEKGRIMSLPLREVKTRWDRPKGQTMGYQPVIDSYEAWTGSTWSDRREVVAWGAGAELILKSVRRDARAQAEYERASAKQRQSGFGLGGARADWYTYRESVHQEGVDDIASVAVLRPEQRRDSEEDEESEGETQQGDGEEEEEEDEDGQSGEHRGTEHVLVGRTSGELGLFRLGARVNDFTIREYDTGFSPIQSAGVSGDAAPLVAASLADGRTALYAVHGEECVAAPLSSVEDNAEGDNIGSVWSTRFLARTRLALGRGPTREVVHVYDVRPEGLSARPTRVFGPDRVDDEGKLVEVEAKTSVYPIVPLPASSAASDAPGDLFLSGGFDGYIRLHDLRSERDCVAALSDPVGDNAIFSLATVGRERIIAGGSSNALLKVFDVRMPGGRVYWKSEASYKRRNMPEPHPNATAVGTPMRCDYANNIFVDPFNQFMKRNWASSRRSRASPVYSLSRPSPSSSSLYVGVENNVVHFNFTSMMDETPDPLFHNVLVPKANGPGIDPKKSWSPSFNDMVLSLSMYSQTELRNFALRWQRPVGAYGQPQGTQAGFDERWMKANTQHSVGF